MANLKDLRASIASVQSTKRITSAMKMVAAAKLRRATSSFESSKEYIDSMADMIEGLAKNTNSLNHLMVGTGDNKTHLVVVIASDRGLCGGFNGGLNRKVKLHIEKLKNDGKNVKLITVGRKAEQTLKREYADCMIESYLDLNKPTPNYNHAEVVGNKIIELFKKQQFDVCSLFFNKFVSPLEQTPFINQIIPHVDMQSADGEAGQQKKQDMNVGDVASLSQDLLFEYEPSEDGLLEELLPKNLKVQIFGAMLESFVGEQGARMTAMDNATRNASDIINELSVKYNRTRQAQITNELIEIISGAAAL